MNVWKPIALCLATGLVVSVGVQTASADKNPNPAPSLTGPCFDQPNMAHAKQAIEDALGFLHKAEHNKGGWRERAIAGAEKVRDEINTGCAVANDKK